MALEMAAVVAAGVLGRGASVCTVRRAGGGDGPEEAARSGDAASRTVDGSSHDHVTVGMCSGGRRAAFLPAAAPCSVKHGTWVWNVVAQRDGAGGAGSRDASARGQ